MKILKFLALSLFAAFLAAAPARAGKAEEEAALILARTLADESHAAMTAGELDETARFARLTEVIGRAFAFDIWERFLVGDRGLSDGELTEFRSLLPGFLARLYADQFGKGLEAEPVITGARSVRRDVLVAAEIPRTGRTPLPVDYRIRAFPDRGPLVIDVMVGGVSFLVLKRDEFRGLLKSEGVNGLLAFMRERSS